MNILMVADDFFPDVMGGSGRVVNELSRRLVKRGHNIYILTRMAPNKRLPAREDIEGIKVYRYNVNVRNAVTFFISTLVNTNNAFAQILKEAPFDLINFHQPLSALGVILSESAKQIPKVYTFHSSWPKEYRVRRGKSGFGFFIRRWLEKRVLDGAQKMFVLSRYSRDELLNMYKAADSKIEIVPGGVDTDKFRPAGDKKTLKAKLGIPLDKHLLLSIRNLVPRMGLENLIEAVSILIKKKSNLILIIGGEGFLEDKLKKQVKSLELEEYIKFAGGIRDEELPLYYQAADIFILPTKYLEGFGLVTLESLSCGTPVLGTPVGGTKEILGALDEDLLFKDTEAESMADKISVYLSSKDLLAVGRKCRDFVLTNYSWDKMAEEFEKLLGDVP